MAWICGCMYAHWAIRVELDSIGSHSNVEGGVSGFMPILSAHREELDAVSLKGSGYMGVKAVDQLQSMVNRPIPGIARPHGLLLGMHGREQN